MAHWYRIAVQDEAGEAQTFIGASELSAKELASAIEEGRMIRLDHLLYVDRGEVKEWAERDKSVHPTVYIHPRTIRDFMEFRGDPRTTPRT